jgi:hypothetical protein
VEAVSVCPCCAVPLIVGSDVDDGAIAGAGAVSDEQPDDGQILSDEAAGDESTAPSVERFARTYRVCVPIGTQNWTVPLVQGAHVPA